MVPRFKHDCVSAPTTEWVCSGLLAFPFPSIETFRSNWPRTRPEADLSMFSSLEQPIIARALKRAPQERWPSCAAMMADLSSMVVC